MSAKSDYYEVLGVSKSASAQEIKSAYRKQALAWHPDRHKDDKAGAEKRFKEINEAYQILSDPQKRSAYDQFGHQAFSPGGGFREAPGFGGAGPFSQTGRYGPFTYTYTSQGGNGGNPFVGFDFGDPFEIFEQFFGGGNPFRQARSVPRYSIAVDFMDALKGVAKEVEVGGKKRKIKIPPGVDDGSRINFGDFILSIDIKPHEIFQRDGDDIHVKVAVPYSLAVLGGLIEVPTIDGDIKIRIRPGTQSGTILRLRGKGAPRLRDSGRGDEYARISVLVPEKLSKEQKEAAAALKKHGL